MEITRKPITDLPTKKPFVIETDRFNDLEEKLEQNLAEEASKDTEDEKPETTKSNSKMLLYIGLAALGLSLLMKK